MSGKTRRELIEELKASQRQISRLLASMAADQDWQREPAEWSFRYIAAHLAVVERDCHLSRVRRIAAGENPHFSAYSTTGEDFSQRDLADWLRRWIATRRELLDFVAALPPDRLDRTGIHDTVGPMTVLDALELLVEQDQGHVRHLCRLIADYYTEDTAPARTR